MRSKRCAAPPRSRRHCAPATITCPTIAQVEFRIGVNLGDVMVQGDDLLGDGVNVAARLQGAAEPGGICIAGSVYDQIRNKLSLAFTPLGDVSYKNIPQAVRTFAITEAEGLGALPAPAPPRRRTGRRLPEMVRHRRCRVADRCRRCRAPDLFRAPAPGRIRPRGGAGIARNGGGAGAAARRSSTPRRNPATKARGRTERATTRAIARGDAGAGRGSAARSAAERGRREPRSNRRLERVVSRFDLLCAGRVRSGALL